MQRSINDISIEKYGCPFHQLSAFGQREVLGVWNGQQEEITMEHVDQARALEAAIAKIAKLERENLDLWEENEELHLQLLEQDESRTRRSRRSRQATVGTGPNEAVSNVQPDIVWQREGTDEG